MEKVKEQSQNIKKKLQDSQFDTISNIDNYTKILPSIKKLLDDTSEQIKELPQYVLFIFLSIIIIKKNYLNIKNFYLKLKIVNIVLFRTIEIQTLHNKTQILLQETKHTLKDIVTKGVDDIENKLIETKNETKDTIGVLRYFCTVIYF